MYFKRRYLDSACMQSIHTALNHTNINTVIICEAERIKYDICEYFIRH